MRGRILVVDDEDKTAELLVESLHQRGYAAEGVDSGRACLERVERTGADIVLTDVLMPGMSGIELCHLLRERYPEVLPIIVTAGYGLDVAIAAIRAGAYDYITKPVPLHALELALARALDHLALRHELERVCEATDDGEIDGLVGRSAAIRRALEVSRRVATSDATVLVTGESGTGKERFARAIHEMSDRRHEPFVGINCGALPVTLLESELFGHVRGAFTDASRGRVGLFLRAAGGTILLDEVGEMPLEMQAKLLRALQDRTVRPVGGDQEAPMHARVIAATNRDLETEVAARRFREDLYHRINVVAIEVPPLREREGDVLPLAQLMLRRYAERNGKPVRGMSVPAARMLLEYNWPGNVRELENCIERAVAVCRLDQLTVEDLPERLHVSCGSYVASAGIPDELVTLGEMKQRYLRKVLACSHGNKSLAARILGIDRRTITSHLAGAEGTIGQADE